MVLSYKIKNKITIFTFIMSVLVILIHSINVNENDGLSYIFQSFLTKNCFTFAVPSFFIISGFLFFNNVESLKNVFDKIHKRVSSLVIPYLLFNTLYYLLNVLIKKDVGFSFSELYIVAINYKYNPVFWYMLQLIIIILLTPILYMVLDNKFSKYLFFVILIIAVFNNTTNVLYLNIDALYYFYIGAFLNDFIKKLLNKKKNEDRLFNAGYYLINKKFILIFFIISALLIVIRFFTNRNELFLINTYFYYTTILLNILINISLSIFAFYFIDLFFDYNNIYEFMNFNFFLYAMHYMIIRFINIILLILTSFVNSDIMLIIKNTVFLAMPILCVFVIYYIKKVLMRFLPNYYKLMTGGR